jgi:hypothetical protein
VVGREKLYGISIPKAVAGYAFCNMLSRSGNKSVGQGNLEARSQGSIPRLAPGSIVNIYVVNPIVNIYVVSPIVNICLVSLAIITFC